MSTSIIVWIIIIICILAAIISFIVVDTHIVMVKKGEVFSFKNAFNISGFPIITFQQYDDEGNLHNYNFLVDTGSNASYINRSSGIKYEELDRKSEYMDSGGNTVKCEIVNVELLLDNNKYKHEVRLGNFDTSFTEVKSMFGINLHGILGTGFMNAYKYVIDFKEYVVYARK